MSVASTDIYAGRDPQDMPNYAVSEVARYLRMPAPTLRAWVRGTTYGRRENVRRFEPLIVLEGETTLLSFTNLVEAHVLNAIRRRHKISMQKVRRALDYLYGGETSHPLARVQFETDGVDLFVERYGALTTTTRAGQLALREVLRSHLERIERDEAGLAARLYPFVLRDASDQSRPVLIDPRIAFGKPVLTDIRVPTEAIADRFLAGESVAELSFDYDCSQGDIEAAIRYERVTT